MKYPGYTHTLWGQNTANTQTLSLGTAVKFDIADTDMSGSDSSSGAEGDGGE